MPQHTFTLTADQLEQLQREAANLGIRSTLQAIRDAGYSEHKVEKTRQHIHPLGADLNEQLCDLLAQTPEARRWFPRPHLE